MSNIEKVSDIIASKLATKLIMDSNEEEVLAYGAFLLIQTIMSILLVLVFGFVFNVIIEIIIISVSASILRKYSGGAHATSPINCAIIGMIVFGVLSLLVKQFLFNFIFWHLTLIIIVSFVIDFYIIYKYSPVGTVTKPLKNEIKRKRLKRISINCVIGLFISSIILLSIYLYTKQIILINIATCISVGVVWQSITLVSLGQKIIDFMDKVLGGTNKILRRTNK
ncbi:MAG: accessory regulator AgrB [Bacillota bacterium]|jgi:accessory gene regulator B|nr:accessory regulator AgrB [Bacillota bacterium]